LASDRGIIIDLGLRFPLDIFSGDSPVLLDLNCTDIASL